MISTHGKPMQHHLMMLGAVIVLPEGRQRVTVGRVTLAH